MTSTAHQVGLADPVSAHPDRLRDQLADNESIMADMDKKLASLQAVQLAASELLASAAPGDESAKGLLWLSYISVHVVYLCS